jgi:hypothetical protein
MGSFDREEKGGLGRRSKGRRGSEFRGKRGKFNGMGRDDRAIHSPSGMSVVAWYFSELDEESSSSLSSILAARAVILLRCSRSGQLLRK